ncbi:acetyl-CoA carboxylase biotin carboxyl carrier protein [Sporobacter termitidis DSM 10068]|uniref:Biotin carboxyl carrier protein of acetyl-CoA carboxylase n=1 Tax=Sporobacter termitidis DSM 10068 TaxID=1123282 RepID=A0A1M5WJK4_9FIRM|nr:biotin/lipoyl-containing protein [Sporobacter termitidis]SHH87631.1 acetyl-CoA carboxylase biotin carboxyl carrier protein [Sporobacter termitidis DSM 10068]
MSNNILGIFDGSDIDGITALIDKLEKSSFDYLRLEGDGVKIAIGKNGVCESTEASAAKTLPQAAIPAAQTWAPANDAPAAEINSPALGTAAPVPAPTEQTGTEAAPSGAVSEQAGIFIVKSPSYGIFYAQSEPGAPAYVKLGDTVQKGDTLGLLEIMKTFNAITSEAHGEVARIHVQNQEVLEPDQPLFSIKIK